LNDNINMFSVLPIFSPNQIAVFFWKDLNFYFMKTANIPVYGNIDALSFLALVYVHVLTTLESV